MAFVFKLEVLLKQKKRMEELAQREFYEAQKTVQESLAEIDSMYKRVDEVRNEISALQNKGGEGTGYIQQLESFINGHNIRIENKRHEAREQMAVAEEKQEILVECAKEHKSLKLLKEKKHNDYKKDKRKKEAKKIEDLVTMRFRRSYGQ